MRNAGIPVRHARKGIARLQVYSCPSCGVCIDACPMGVVKANSKDATVYLNRQIKRNNERRIEEISDKCLLCGKCTAVCPVGVEGDRIRIAQRSIRPYNLAPDYSNIDENSAILAVNNFVSTNNNIVLTSNNERVLYFAGCMTALTPGIRKSMESVLRKAGVNYRMMDKDGGICCGRPMLMAGRKDPAKEMIRKNTNIIKSSGATTLLLSCPICLKVFKEEYELDGIEIIHHTEFMDRLIAEGRLHVESSDVRYAYHDPCELGRGCGVYEQPRRVVAAAGQLVEGAKTGQESICCGGSLGSLSLGFEQRKLMTENAINNLTAENPDAIVTACPLCKTTFGRYADRPVVDIVEVIDSKTGN